MKSIIIKNNTIMRTIEYLRMKAFLITLFNANLLLRTAEKRDRKTIRVKVSAIDLVADLIAPS
jgi:hypothetical protein